MTRYRKRPGEIEAVRYDATFDLAFLDDDESIRAAGDGTGACLIETLEGTMRAQIGDWIIRGVNGELYPCKPDIFAATYGLVPAQKETEPDAEGALVILERIMTQHWDLAACMCWVCKEGRTAGCRPRDIYQGWKYPEQKRPRVRIGDEP